MTENKAAFKAAAVFFIIVIISIFVILLRKFLPSTQKTAKIMQNGAVIETIDLDKISKPREFEIVSPDGGHNTVRAEKGKIAVIRADCPDKICVRRGFITDGTLPVVCLPHKLSIVIESSSSADAVTGGI